MGKLDGKVAIVTGSSRGIGKAVAELFAAEGAKVVCAARTINEGDHTLEGSLNTTIAEIQKAGGTALAVQTDVSKEEDCLNLVATAKRAFGPVDVLVNNAALNFPYAINKLSTRQWDRSWAVGPRAVFILSREVLQDMIERRTGAIVNISSGAAIGPGRGPYKVPPRFGGTKYGAEKAAIERFTQGLADEVYQYGISVTAFSPSQSVPTPGALSTSAHQSTAARQAVTFGAGGQFEPGEMMARAALLLATEPLDKVTGRVTYSQAILKEFGWIKEGRGTGIDRPGSGYSQQ